MKYLENLFVDLNVGLGKNVNNNFGNKVSTGVFGGYFDAGYDYGISKNLSAVPELGLRFYRYNYPGSTADYSELGPFFSLGLKASF
jgi:hypothetical protein